MKLKLLLSSLIIATITFSSSIALAVDNTDDVSNTSQVTSNQSENDGAVLATIIIVDKNEIAVAREALRRDINPMVRGFARYMIKQHSHNLAESLRLSRKLGIKPDFQAAASVKEQGQKELNHLKRMNDKRFQKAYMNGMVKGHADVLKTLKEDISNIQNRKLKVFALTTARTVKIHLEKAKAIQSRLND